MPHYEFYIVDVFADSSYAGNQLAVVTDSKNLSTSQMQKVAREFNFSESTFISKRKQSYDVRIFTPRNELPFAGHPTLGTAWVIQQHMIKEKVSTVKLDLKIGEVPVTFQYNKNKPGLLWMKQKEPIFGDTFDPHSFSKILGVRPEDIDHKFPIQIVSTGVPFFIVPLRSLKSLKSCKITKEPYFELVRDKEAKSILVFSPEAYNKDSNLAVRVFTEYYGIPEDPATGSGNGCLAAYLANQEYFGKKEIDVTVDQGYEIDRPSKLFLKTEGSKKFGVKVGGRVFPVAQGTITL